MSDLKVVEIVVGLEARVERLERLVERLIVSEIKSETKSGEKKEREKCKWDLMNDKGWYEYIYEVIDAKYNLEINDKFAKKSKIRGLNWIDDNGRSVCFEIVNIKELVEKCGIDWEKMDGVSESGVATQVGRFMRMHGFIGKVRRYGMGVNDKKHGYRIALR